MRDDAISRMRRSPCEKFVIGHKKLPGFVLMRYAGRATVTFREDPKSREECEEDASGCRYALIARVFAMLNRDNWFTAMQ